MISEKNYVNGRIEVLEMTFERIKYYYNGTDEAVSKAISEFQKEYGLDIIVRIDNEIIYINRPSKIPIGIFGNRLFYVYEDQATTYSENPEVVFLNKGEEHEEVALYGKFESNGETVYVDIIIHMEAINASLDAFFESILMNSLIVILISLFFAIIMSRVVSKPISEMEFTISALSKLDFKTKLSENWKVKEIAEVSASINSMSSKLEESIFQLSKANEQLKKDIDLQKKLERMRKEFIANVSHEMKTPVALLQIYGENLKNNVKNIDRDFYLDTIIEETNNLNELIVKMLDVSSLDSDFNKMEFEKFSLSELTTSIVDSFEPILEKYNCIIDISPNIEVNGDKGYIKQAIGNYMNNAISHTKTGEEIVIKLYVENEKAIFSIYNQGVPVAEEDIEYIWDSFYRVDKARSRKEKNIGMGLYIVRTVINKHEGSYEVRNLEQGVEFSFSLKVSE